MLTAEERKRMDVMRSRHVEEEPRIWLGVQRHGDYFRRYHEDVPFLLDLVDRMSAREAKLNDFLVVMLEKARGSRDFAITISADLLREVLKQ